MPRLAALHLPFQAPSVRGVGAYGLVGYSLRMSTHRSSVEFLALGRRWSIHAASSARRNAKSKVGFIGAAPEGAEFSARCHLRASEPALSVSRRERFARLYSAACAPWLAKAHFSRSRRPVARRAPCSAVLTAPWPNTTLEGTAGTLRLPVPSALRAPAAPQLRRSASHAP